MILMPTFMEHQMLRRLTAYAMLIPKDIERHKNPIMKFVLTQVTDGGSRLGRLSHISGHGSTAMETPNCILYTHAGSVPNLSRDIASKICNVPPFIQVATPTIIPSQETLVAFEKGLAAFSGQPDSPVYLTVHNPISPCPSGYNDRSTVSVWCNRGRVRLSPEDYMSLVESCHPTMFEALSDGDTPEGSSTKRIRKSVDRSLHFLDTCLEICKSSKKLQSAAMLGVLQGGNLLSQRKWCAKEVAKRPVAGVVVGSLHEGTMEESARWSLLTEVLKEIPDNKLRILPRSGRPDEVLKAVQCGIDVFDTAFPCKASERGCALAFSFQPMASTGMHTEQGEPTKDTQTNKSPNSSDANCTEAVADSRTKSEEEETETESKDEKTAFEIDLKESRYFDDFGPVFDGCDCYCCQNHTRAYINHLLNTKELLARVLLTVHNLHHYFAFFKAIRDSIAKGTFQKLVDTVINHR